MTTTIHRLRAFLWRRRLDVLAGLLFGCAIYQERLFTNNQFTYYLAGLARSGWGFLAEDWRAGQPDCVPVFSALVWVLNKAHALWLSYPIFILLAAVFAWSLLAIVRRMGRPGASDAAVLVAFAGATLLLVDWRIGRALDAMPPLAHAYALFAKVAYYAREGLALMAVPEPYLEPNVFGAFLVASVAFFVWDQPRAAVACAAFAATVHPTYLLHAAILTFAYMAVIAGRREFRRAILLGLLSLALVLPTVAFVLASFRPVSPEVSAAGMRVFLERAPHHAVVSVWFDRCAQAQVLLFGVALVLARRVPALFRVLGISALVTLTLTLFQVATGNGELAILMPWRTATWLFPIGTVVIVAWLADRAFAVAAARGPAPGKRARWVRRLRLAALAFLFAGGLVGLGRTLTHPRRTPLPRMTAWIRAQAGPGQTFVVPLDYQWFRLDTGLPILVDWKTDAVAADLWLKWKARVDLVRAFYAAPDAAAAEAVLRRMLAVAPVTHVLLPSAPGPDLRGSGAFELLYEADGHRLFRVRPGERANAPGAT